jgi:hypothetical protein
LGIVFPRNRDHYRRYLSFDKVSQREVDRWKRDFKRFLEKLTWLHEKPLILKSPAHTYRVKLLTEIYPESKFIIIYRHPVHVIQSTLHTLNRVPPYRRLQEIEDKNRFTDTVKNYQRMIKAFSEEKGRLPKGCLYEVRFEDLEKDTIGELRRLYRDLRLPDFNQVESDFKIYLESLKGYRKNAYPPLSKEDVGFIYRKCRRIFDEWGYLMPSSPPLEEKTVPGRPRS